MSIPTVSRGGNPLVAAARAQAERDAAQPTKKRRGLFGLKRDRPQGDGRDTHKGRRRHRVGADHSQPTGWVRHAPASTAALCGFKAMLPSGVAWLGADEWSVTLHMSAVDYLSVPRDGQAAIVQQWAEVLNTMRAGSRLQLSVVNRVLSNAEVASMLSKPDQGDRFDALRRDFNTVVTSKLSAKRGNTLTDRYVTITVQVDDEDRGPDEALELAREFSAQVKKIQGCVTQVLDRTERLRLISRMTRPWELFTFDEATFEPKKLAAVDYVAPWAVERGATTDPLVFHNGSGDQFVSTVWVRDYPVWLSDEVLTSLSAIPGDIAVSLHMEPYDQEASRTLVQRQVSELEMQAIAEQRKAAKQHLSEDMIPHSLVTALDEARATRAELEQSNEKLFSTVLAVKVAAVSRDELDTLVRRVMSAVRGKSCPAEIATHMQAEAFTTCLPLGIRAIPMRRTLTTAAAATLVPFTNQEAFEDGGYWYGANARSGEAVVLNRTTKVNGNGFILGTTGSGKSQAAKLEITNTFLSRPDDDIIIIDPEHEYQPLIDALGGQIIQLFPGGTQRLNPMDMAADGGETDPVKEKSATVVTLLSALLGGQDGIGLPQRSIIDRCCLDIFSARRADPSGPAPTLETLRAALIASGTDTGREVAESLEIYTAGSLDIFSHATTVDMSSRLIGWDISRVGTELRHFAVMVICDQIWQRISANREQGRRTWLYIDEFHVLFANPASGEYFKELWKRGRKWGLLATGITQNIDELLASDQARLMLSNSTFLELLGQTSTDAETLTEVLKVSPLQASAFTNVAPGQGFIRCDQVQVAFDARMDDSSLLYRLFTTKFGEHAGVVVGDRDG
ncbi:DUF87 domain-containing protein [Propionibacterium freudenreichii]|nr:DUF87 domain-containing protein [Propionibacterium freudenreichii]